MRHKVGDIVKISKKSEFYDTGRDNDPKDTEGEIERIATGSFNIIVNWVNNRSDWYNESDLKLVKRPKEVFSSEDIPF